MGSVKIGLILGLLFGGIRVWAQTDRIQIGGSARVRAEFRDNADFSNTTGDKVDFFGSRFRLDMKVHAVEKVIVFLQPQYSKIWGEPVFVPSGVATNTAANTSGATKDTPIDIHQAYMAYQPEESFSFIFGRKELNYGDELLVGGLGWSNFGRSFDLALASYKHSYGIVDVFHSIVIDRNTTGAGAGDREFSGIYASNKISEVMAQADAYVLYSSEPSTSPSSTTTAYGIRLKSPVGPFDYRGEATFENVTTTESTGERSYDIEAGYTLDAANKLRFAVEWFSASAGFDQLFPTGHKWLGYADLFSRRNIQGYRAKVTAQIFSSFVAAVDYHHFERQDVGRSAYKINGTSAYGVTGDSGTIANEYDIVLTYILDENFTLEGGASLIMPSDYLKNNGASDNASFYYLQAATSF
ncbi:MAG: alginate export family protein [Deltaproteobacteria bacterium]|nr:alginate export family protein [Deltaproteobacteria bacterium]